MPVSPRRQPTIGCRLIANLNGADICVKCGAKVNRAEIGLIICGNCHTVYASVLGAITRAA